MLINGPTTTQRVGGRVAQDNEQIAGLESKTPRIEKKTADAQRMEKKTAAKGGEFAFKIYGKPCPHGAHPPGSVPEEARHRYPPICSGLLPSPRDSKRFQSQTSAQNEAMLRGDCAREKNLIERDLQRRKEEMMEIQILNVVRVPECAVEISRAR